MPEALNVRKHVAILDIGSNAVRLVVYDGLNRAPIKIYTERNICSLGADLSATGKLNPDGVRKALDSIGRFAGLIAAMRIKNVQAVATAALRDASDGAEFIRKVQKDFGLKIRIIDGEEEARLSAIGVMMNGLGAAGVIGDFGGGSLELILVEDGKVRHKASLPIGSHRLQAVKTREERIALIDAALDQVDFLKDCKDRDFYALGGAWRSMAKTHIRLTGHPLKVLDQYTIKGDVLSAYADDMSRQSLEQLEKTAGLSKKRVQDMGVAALALERVFARIKPARIVFSGTGLREGLLYDQLPPALKKQDALIAGCRKIAMKISRFDNLKSFNALMEWMHPLFAGATPEALRLLEAACLLSDTAWFEHEDYQALHTFERLLVAPIYGVDHASRAFIALSQYVRYAGAPPEDILARCQNLLTLDAMGAAIVAGLAMQAGYMMTGGALSLLQHSSLKVTPKNLTLNLNAKAAGLSADIVNDAMQNLAAHMGREFVLKVA